MNYSHIIDQTGMAKYKRKFFPKNSEFSQSFTSFNPSPIRQIIKDDDQKSPLDGKIDHKKDL